VADTQADLQDFATRYTAAWCSQDASRVAAFFAADGSLSVNDGAPAVGREAIHAVAQSFMTVFPDLRVILDQLVIETDRADYHWTLLGTHTSPGGSGNQVRIRGVEHWSIGSDGLIAASRGEFDAAEYQRQIAGS
jgi:uncharacterized protein (TIGR02246 family)